MNKYTLFENIYTFRVYLLRLLLKGGLYLKKIAEFHTSCEEETENAARTFAKQLKAGDFLAFFGDLGSGKTAFIRGLAAVFCKDVRVSSPTYAIVNEYRGTPPLFHFDLYRVPDEDSLYATGFYDYFERGGIMACEWCENIPYALPDKRYEIRFEKTAASERVIRIFDASEE